MVVLWKAIEVHQGQQYLFDERRCFFYITNDWETPAEDIVTQHANKRCNQENVIQQLKSDVLALTAPVDTFNGNWAYMVMASLAWSLKIWVSAIGTRRSWRQFKAAPGEAVIVANGFLYLSTSDDQYPCASSPQRTASDLSTHGLESLADHVLPTLGTTSASAQMLTSAH